MAFFWEHSSFMHFIKFAWRRFTKDPQFTLLNLVGLSVGLTAAILIYLWVYDEWTYDKFFQNDKQLYQVMTNDKQNDLLVTTDGGSPALANALKRDLPAVEYAVSTTPEGWFKKFNLTAGPQVMKATGNFAGKDYFNVFPYQLLEGDRAQLLTDKRSIVISAQLAKKLFNRTDHLLNKVITWNWQTFSGECVITGVYETPPANASRQLDFVLSTDAWRSIVSWDDNDLSGGPYNTYIVLKKGADADKVSRQLTGFIQQKMPQATAALSLRKYSSAYLYGNYENGVQAGGRIEYLKLFSFIALFILIIACINFMNLSTAKAADRIKEVGVKKTLGAGRRELVAKFLGESILMSFISLLIALVLVQFFLPWFNRFTGKELALLLDGKIIAAIVGITLFTGLVAGSYPAFYLSRFRPAVILKGKASGSAAEVWLRKGLVVFQFSLSFIFIVAVIVVYNQVKFIQSKKPGYNKDNIVYFEMEGKVAEKRDAFLAALNNTPGVVAASSTMNSIILPTFTPWPGVYWDGKNKDDKIRFYQMPVNYDIIETLGIDMAAGRSFSRSFGTDSTGIIINEAAANVMGLQDPIGKVVNVWGKDKHIVGVTKNFHFNSLHEAIRPFIFSLEPKSTMLIMARIDQAKEAATLKAMNALYKDFNPGFPFDYKFLDEDYQKQYAAENLVATLSKYFAGLTIIISCLGLFGLAAFTAESRRKEIGIRKVLGASVSGITGMLSKDLLRLVLLGILISVPLSWWAMHQWLQGFAYRVSFNAMVPVLAAVSLLLLTVLTISFHAIRSALANPVESLRSE